VTKIGNLGCPNHGSDFFLFMKSLNMILNSGNVLGYTGSSSGARYAVCVGESA